MSYVPQESSLVLFTERTFLQGALVSAVVYGGHMVLYAMTVHLLLQQNSSGNRERTFYLIAYSSILALLGTLFEISSQAFTQMAFIDNREYPGGPSQYEFDNFAIPIDTLGNVAYVLANWFSDAAVLWRVVVIYRSTNYPLWKIMFLPCLLFLASWVIGVLYMIQIGASSPWKSSSINWTIPSFSLSIVVNVVLTTAIVIRLFLFRRRITSLLGPEHGSEYTSIASMVIESATISTIFFIAFVITFAIGNEITNVFLQTLPQVQIFASLLIIFRVAQGRGWSANTHTVIMRRTSRAEAQMHDLSQIRFNSRVPASTTMLDSSRCPESSSGSGDVEVTNKVYSMKPSTTECDSEV